MTGAETEAGRLPIRPYRSLVLGGALAAAVLFLVGCGDRSSPEPTPSTLPATWITHEDDSFTISYPRVWQVIDPSAVEAAGSALSAFSVGYQSGSFLTVTIEPLAADTSPGVYASSVFQGLPSDVVAVTVLVRVTIGNGGREAFVFETERAGSSEEADPVRAVHVVTAEGNQGWAASCFAFDPAFNDVCRAAVLTLEIVDSDPSA